MRKNFKATLAVALTGLMLQGPFATAQEGTTPKADPTQILATVNGTEITLGHIIAARASLPPEYSQLPAALLFNGLLDQLVQQTLLGQSFDGELSLQSQIILENEERAVIAGEAITTFLNRDVDQAELRKLYEEQYPEVEGELEYRASHILVETENKAQDIVAELEGGAVFSALANERSIGPSASVGGDLGWFGDGDMVDPFYEAVITLKPGENSGPVKTQFGWHVINLAETRAVERPAFETVRRDLENEIQQSKLEAHIEELTAQGDVDRADLSGIDPDVITQTDLLEN